MDDVQRLESLKRQLSELQSKAAVAQADIARITERLTALLAELPKHGATSYEGAVELLATKRDELDAEFKVVEEQLNAVRSK